MNSEVITVATHEEGLLKELINNNFNIKVRVLGFGEKWTGFKMKFELVYDYIKDLPENKIIIFLDGFDSTIKGTAEEAAKRFIQLNSKILYSKDVDLPFFGLERFIWPRCKGNIIVNSGMYMGYVKYLKLILKEVLNDKCKDDQVAVNRLCKKFDFIDIDEKELIFKNIYNTRKLDNEIYKSNALFFSQPGQLSSKRIFRAFFEYGQFFLPFLFIIYFLIIYILLKIEYIFTIPIISLLFAVYLWKIDKSCFSTNMYKINTKKLKSFKKYLIKFLITFHIITSILAITLCYKKHNGFCIKSTLVALIFPVMYISSVNFI